jgi:hypothetical protein
LFSAWSYRDIPTSSINALSLQFGQTGPEFTQFITTTGLVDQNGVPKQAWSTFVNQAPTFASNCTGL